MSYNLGYNNPAPDDGDYLVYKNRKMLQEYASSNLYLQIPPEKNNI